MPSVNRIHDDPFLLARKLRAWGAVLDSHPGRMDVASLMMDSAERDALCGDLAESGESESQALREVLSLVSDGVQFAPRVASVTDFRQPYGMRSVLVSLVSRRTSAGTVIYLRLCVKNWERARDFRNIVAVFSRPTIGRCFPNASNFFLWCCPHGKEYKGAVRFLRRTVR
jgi:hypothetical protein